MTVLKNILVVHKMGYNAEEKQALDVVISVLKKNNCLFRLVSRLEVHQELVQTRDLIIIVGGDGTFLKVAQFTNNAVPFLCINANPKHTEGFFSSTTPTSCEKKIQAIIAGKIKQKKIWRLIAKINGKEIEPCTNEYYVGQKKPYDVAKYILRVGKNAELQKSSGVLVCTAAGSTAWCRGAGGKVLPMTTQKFQYIVREPYVGKHIITKIKKGILGKQGEVKITAKTEGMVVVADAIGREHELKKDTHLEIKMHHSPLLLF